MVTASAKVVFACDDPCCDEQREVGHDGIPAPGVTQELPPGWFEHHGRLYCEGHGVLRYYGGEQVVRII